MSPIELLWTAKKERKTHNKRSHRTRKQLGREEIRRFRAGNTVLASAQAVPIFSPRRLVGMEAFVCCQKRLLAPPWHSLRWQLLCTPHPRHASSPDPPGGSLPCKAHSHKCFSCSTGSDETTQVFNVGKHGC